MAADPTPGDLRSLANEMVDAMLDPIADCADRRHVPDDPAANDAYAANERRQPAVDAGPRHRPHHGFRREPPRRRRAGARRQVSRALAAVAWQTVTTIEQCRELGGAADVAGQFDMWADGPNLSNTYRIAKATSRQRR
jgi:hypothetical protein